MSDFFRDLDRQNTRGLAEPAGVKDRHLALLADLARDLSAVVDLGDLARVALRRLLHLTSGDRAALYVISGHEGPRLLMALNRDGTPLCGDTLKGLPAIIDRIVATGQAELGGNAILTEGGQGKTSSLVLGLTTHLCVPLESHRGRIGAIFIDRVAGKDLDADDLVVSKLVAMQASQAIELLRLEEEKRKADRVALENEYLRRLSRRTAEEARTIEKLNAELRGRTETLSATSAFLSSILESSTEYAIIATDRAGTISTFNAGAVRTYGWSPKEVVGLKPLSVLFHGANGERSFPPAEDAVTSGSVVEGESHRLAKDGREILVHAATTTIRDRQGRITGYVDISRDVTRESEMRRQVLLSEKMTALGTLAAGVSHEFNNLLQGIIGFLEQAKASPDETVRERAIDVSLSAATRAAQLTRQLQSVGRPQVSKPAPHQLDGLVAETLTIVEKSFASEGVEIVRECSPSRPAVVDKSRILQVLLNLVTNARHAVRGSSEKRVVVRTFQEAEWCVLAVTDTGCGMSPDVARRIFEPFFTTKGALGGEVYDGKVHGTGLGLAISRGIVSEHGGHIELATEQGRGTTFRVLLPAAPAGVEVPDAKDSHRLPAKPARKKLRVLVVDDEASIRELLRSVLELRGHSVIVAADGEEGLRVGLETTFDVVVADYQMPKVNGARFFRTLAGCEARKILITGMAPGELDVPESVDVVLEKPYSVADMVAAVEAPDAKSGKSASQRERKGS